MLRVVTDDEHLCRGVDLFHLDGGRVAEHVIFCTGMWDPATITRQRSEGPDGPLVDAPGQRPSSKTFRTPRVCRIIISTPLHERRGA